MPPAPGGIHCERPAILGVFFVEARTRHTLSWTLHGFRPERRSLGFSPLFTIALERCRSSIVFATTFRLVGRVAPKERDRVRPMVSQYQVESTEARRVALARQVERSGQT